MSQCPNCGLQRGLHHSILPGCLCTTASPFTYAVQQPQRTWQGLTQSDFNEIYDLFANKVSSDFIFEKMYSTIEAKLKERNI